MINFTEHLTSRQVRGLFGTAGAGSVVPDLLEEGPTPTQTSARITDQSSSVRAFANAMSSVATEVHQNDYMVELRVRTNTRIGTGPQISLRELADLGFAWRDIARMLGVSVAAIQKWRRGEGVSGGNARRIANLLAACDLVQRMNPMVTDVALWFETPIVDEAPVTPIDLWAAGDQQLVLEHARVDVDPHETMDSFQPEWRETYRSEFESFRAGDGNVSIRPRGH